MTLDRKLMTALRGALLGALTMITVGLSLGWLAGNELRRAQATRTAAGQAHGELTELTARLSRSLAGEHEAQARLARLRQMQARGLLGDERRSEWMELLAEIRTARRLLDLRYEFAPARRQADDAAVDGGIRISDMRLQLALLHEGDLLAVLDDLRTRAPAYIRVRHCRLSRLGDDGRTTHPAALLDADCMLEWITFPPAGEPS